MAMSNKEFSRAVRAVHALITKEWRALRMKQGVPVSALAEEIPAEELTSYEKDFCGLSDQKRLQHLAHMCLQTHGFFERAGTDRNKRERGVRWLGFIQGALWWAGLASFKDMHQKEGDSHGS